MSIKLTDCYKILECDVNDNDEKIKKTYRRKALQHHPDRHPNATPEEKIHHTEKFKKLSAAFTKIMKYRRDGEILSDNDLSDDEFDTNFSHEFFDDEILQFFGINTQDIQQFNEVIYLLQNDALIDTFGHLVFNPNVISEFGANIGEVFVHSTHSTHPTHPTHQTHQIHQISTHQPQPKPQQKPLIVDAEFKPHSFKKHRIKTIRLKLGERIIRIKIKLNVKNKKELVYPIDTYKIEKEKYKLPRNIIINTKVRKP